MSTKVLHVSAIDFTAEKLLAPQMSQLARHGYSVRVACGRTGASSWSALAPFDPVDVAFPRSLAPRLLARAAVDLLKHVRDWKPDLVHLHTPAAAMPLRMLPRWAWGPSKPAVVYTVHGYLHMWPPTGVGHLVQAFEALMARRTDAMLFQSREDYEESYSRRYRSELVYLGNGVEDRWFAVPPASRTEMEPLRVGFVGRVVREKGILDLLEAARRLPRVEVHIFGDSLSTDRDPVREAALALSESRELRGRVVWHGMVSRSQLLEGVAGLHWVCLPSYREGVPRSVIEALAAARPVVASRIRGSRELVRDADNGFLHAPGDVPSLVTALERAQGTSGPDYDRLAERARQSVDPERREWAVFDRLAACYEQVLARRARDLAGPTVTDGLGEV